jgi:hypothetical protein
MAWRRTVWGQVSHNDDVHHSARVSPYLYDSLSKVITCVDQRIDIIKVRRDTGAVVDIIIMGDFNRHDQLWGGDVVSLSIVDSQSPYCPSPCHVFVPRLSKLLRANSFMRSCDHLRKAIIKVRRDTGAVVDIIIMGDFNRHDQLN